MLFKPNSRFSGSPSAEPAYILPNMKYLSIFLRLALICIISCVMISCVTLKAPKVTRYSPLDVYDYVYIPATGTHEGATASYVLGILIPYANSVTPRDVIAGMLSKSGYIIIPTLEEENKERTLIVTYGQSERRDIAGGLFGYTMEVTLQFVSAKTNKLVAFTTAEGMGETEADGIRNAIQRAITNIFEPEAQTQRSIQSKKKPPLKSYLDDTYN